MNEDKIAPAGEIADNGQEKSYGKFKSAEELLKAYNALEGEFTKRSQKLSEYEKKSAEPDWESKVNKFVGKYPIAEKYAEELAGEITKNGNKEIDETCLERALLTVLSSKVKTTDEMAEDENVIDKVLSSEKNRNSIISRYLDGIRKNVPPTTLPKGGAIPVTTPMSARTIRDAGEIAKKILND